MYLLLQVTHTELEKLKSTYRQAVREAAQAKRKYQETSKGGEVLVLPTSLNRIGFILMILFFLCPLCKFLYVSEM